MPFVKIDLSSDAESVTAYFRPSVSLEDKGATEQCWSLDRSSDDITDEDIAAWRETPTGLPENIIKLVIVAMAALANDPHEYEDIRLLYDLEPDGLPPAEEPEVLHAPETVKAIQALCNEPNMCYR